MFGQDWIINAIRELSTFLEVDESGTNLRRTTQVQEPKGQHERSVYAVSTFVITSSPGLCNCAHDRSKSNMLL
jgi:hypothetical protein